MRGRHHGAPNIGVPLSIAPIRRFRTALLLLPAVAGLQLAGSVGTASAGDLKCPRGTERHGKRPPDGRKEWCSRPDGTQHGPSVSYYETGAEMARAMFDDGEMDGMYQAWHPNGQLAESGNYSHDKKDGVFTTRTPDGRPLTEESFRNGALNGSTKIWFDNGQLMVDATYVNGVRHGMAVTYYENGQMRTRGEFKNGAYHGKWQGWYPDGSLQKVAEFDEGEELSRQDYPPKSDGGG